MHAPVSIERVAPKGRTGSCRAGEIYQGSAGVAQSVEHLFCKQAVSGSSPLASSSAGIVRIVSEGCPSGQREQAVNLPAHAYVGSNPTPSTNTLCVIRHAEGPAGVAQLVERQPSKLNVVGSNPISRSDRNCASVLRKARKQVGDSNPPFVVVGFLRSSALRACGARNRPVQVRQPRAAFYGFDRSREGGRNPISGVRMQSARRARGSRMTVVKRVGLFRNVSGSAAGPNRGAGGNCDVVLSWNGLRLARGVQRSAPSQISRPT